MKFCRSSSPIPPQFVYCRSGSEPFCWHQAKPHHILRVHARSRKPAESEPTRESRAGMAPIKKVVGKEYYSEYEPTGSIARHLKIPPSSVYKALQLAACLMISDLSAFLQVFLDVHSPFSQYGWRWYHGPRTCLVVSPARREHRAFGQWWMRSHRLVEGRTTTEQSTS